MKKYDFTLLLTLFSTMAQASDAYYEVAVPRTRQVKKLIANNAHHLLAYQLLRTTEKCIVTHKNDERAKRAYQATTALWIKIKNASPCNTQEELHYLLETYADYLTPHLDEAEKLGVYQKTVWDKSTQRFGSGTTTVLKATAAFAIISTFAICPAAAVATTFLKGSFKKSCTITKEQKFSSTDQNIKGDLVLLEAQCKYDREDHGLKTNTIIVPESGPCGYLHNRNGTLVATETQFYYGQTEQLRETAECPELAGSFRKTCGKVVSAPYRSTDSRIPVGALCSYEVRDCKSKKWDAPGKAASYLVPTAEVECHGSRIENCDGTLVVRKSGQSDSQCAGEKAEGSTSTRQIKKEYPFAKRHDEL